MSTGLYIAACQARQLHQRRMRRRWLLLPLALLPTITETLEDSPCIQLPTAQPNPASLSTTDDYMASIQALARPLEAVSFGPVRVQRLSPRPRLFSKGQMNPSTAAASLPRVSRRTGLSLLAPERLSHRTVGERDCIGRDPVDWLFGQTQMRT